MARVIRRPLHSKVTPRAVIDARSRADEVMQTAEARAHDIVQAATAAAEQGQIDAKARGLEEGRAEAAMILQKAHAIRDAALADAKAEVASLAMTAAERIVSAELTSSPQAIMRIVEDAISAVRRARRLKVEVHPEDVDHIDNGSLPAFVEVVANVEITRGGCIVKSDLGRVDATLETRLTSIAQALRGTA